MYELLKNRMVPKCSLCGLSGMMQKTWSCICGFTGVCHCTVVEGVKHTVVCYFHGRMFNPTNLLI